MTASRSEDPTEGGRWIVVDGRRWRATDPHLPEGLRQELVEALMAARRSVADAKRGDKCRGGTGTLGGAGQKMALGERGDLVGALRDGTPQAGPRRRDYLA
ncbi:MAG: hypothetical protein R2704_18630 [Microthrixaceae bacterium]